MSRFPALSVLSVLLCACAAPQTKQLLTSPPAHLPTQATVKAVPFVAQRSYYCGPAALAMAMKFYGLSVSQETLARQVFVPQLKGSLKALMLAATRQREMLAYLPASDLRNLLTEIASGHPVVVLQNLGLSWYPSWHYAVAIGYDLKAGELILHSGGHRAYKVALETFERTWVRAGSWALVPLPPDTLPADDDPLRYLMAVEALEETGHLHSAQQAYALAARRWPDNLIARMGLGNTRYALGDTISAAHAFLSAVTVDPRSAAAYNNLALSLSALGCKRSALKAVRRALALDRSSDPNYRDTFEDISRSPAAEIEPVKCLNFRAGVLAQTN
jgi:tetratricopeptide (TPR) repeat protein